MTVMKSQTAVTSHFSSKLSTAFRPYTAVYMWDVTEIKGCGLLFRLTHPDKRWPNDGPTSTALAQYGDRVVRACHVDLDPGYTPPVDAVNDRISLSLTSTSCRSFVPSP